MRVMNHLDIDVVVTRGTVVESRHRVHAAVVDAQGQLRGVAGESGVVTHWRSCAKPFQVMPLVRDGGFDSLAWDTDQLALACASHGGEPEHVAGAARMLADIGLTEGDLACGPHEPLSARGLELLRTSGETPTRLHNNCSGKHAAMLARARTAGYASSGYHHMDHPIQRECLAEVSAWSDVRGEDIPQAVDGCGVVVFALPLEAMALAYARLADAARASDPVAARVVGAMQSRPFLIGGTDRFDTTLIEETDGRVIAKIGAEGVHSFAIVSEGLGFAIKVEDGAMRAQLPAVLALLQQFGGLPRELPPRLAAFASSAIYNTRGEHVGDIRVGSSR